VVIVPVRAGGGVSVTLAVSKQPLKSEIKTVYVPPPIFETQDVGLLQPGVPDDHVNVYVGAPPLSVTVALPVVPTLHFGGVLVIV
jgi:hypothetical protein